MSGVEKERILRINCPGFGVQSYLSAGCAQPLTDYEVLIVNPISVLHLFDKDPDLLKQIEAAQQDGMTSYMAKSDKLISSVYPDLDARKEELAMFLSKGGLLIYFLCPPFIVQGPAELMDNYSWLDILAPDNSQNKAARHMSSASRGKNIELAAEQKDGPFAHYFRQPGVEWTTIIRAEKLAEGYEVLASAGPSKCVAGQLSAGDSGGRVVFLPAPYQAELDRGLIEAINAWASNKSAGAPTARSAPPPEAPRPQPQPQPQTEPDMPPPEPKPVAEKPAPESAPPPEREPEKAAAPEPAREAPEKPPEEAKPEPAAREAKPEPKPEPRKDPPPEPVKAEAETPKAPQAKDLMDKMEEIAKPSVPEWCLEYSFSDLDQLREQLLELNEQVRLTQVKIGEVEGRIETMEWLKNALLSLEGEDLMRACTKVFGTLGWQVKPSSGNSTEMWLADGDYTAAIARVVRTTTQVKRSDLAQLCESVITYWGEHETVPKGVLVASTWANGAPTERTDEDYTDALAEFAEKKNLCLMTTSQLLCIFRDVEGGYMSVDDLKETILATSGRLQGFVLEPGLATATN